jgi:hypothetical protein
MAARKSRHNMRFRGIARWLWVGVGVLLAGLLIQAWLWPPPEGFAAFARKMILILIVCFVCAPFVSSGLVSLTVWLLQKSPEKD